MSYRFDIAILRSIAIILVVLFHYEISIFSGGFVGVDIFFVISGYLMTRIIVESMSSGTFSAKNFLISRFNRLLPALAFMLVVISIYLLIFELPSILRNFSKNGLVSLFPISNWIYMTDTGYFNTNNLIPNLLIHTWSLSIEWQFYLGFPILLLISSKIFRSKSAFESSYYFCIILFVASLALTLLTQPNYYDTSYRIWEITAGSFVFFFDTKTNNKESKLLFISTLVGLTLCGLLISSTELWPNLYSLIVIMLTAVALITGFKQGNSNSNLVINYISERSYSIYLWHWPIFHLTEKSVVISILVTILLSEITYRFIETPLRKKSLKVFVINLIFVSSTALLSFCFFMLMLTNHAEKISPLPNNVIKANRALLDKDPRKDRCLNVGGSSSEKCIYPKTMSSFHSILIGDSHASSVITSLEKSKFGNEGILLVAKAGCLINDGSVNYNKLYKEACTRFSSNNISDFVGYNIFITSRWSLYEKKVRNELDYSAFFNIACELAQENNVFILNPTPEFEYLVPNQVAYDLWSGREEGREVNRNKALGKAPIFRHYLLSKVKSCGLKVLEPSNYLCDSKNCKTSTLGIPIYYDDNHLSEAGNKILVDMFNSI
ncbi:acyltransferase family protein [Pseudoalteromonas xiamenensis]